MERKTHAIFYTSRTKRKKSEKKCISGRGRKLSF